jgi:hypothetical protein
VYGGTCSCFACPVWSNFEGIVRLIVAAISLLRALPSSPYVIDLLMKSRQAADGIGVRVYGVVRIGAHVEGLHAGAEPGISVD